MKLTSQKVLVILGAVGIGISGYLTYIDLKVAEPVCLPGTNCIGVLTSRYAHVLGVPVALLGLLMYTLLTASVILIWPGNNPRKDLIALGVFGLALAGTLYSAYLLYLELFKIHSICTWCVASGLVIISILVVASRMLLAQR